MDLLLTYVTFTNQGKNSDTGGTFELSFHKQQPRNCLQLQAVSYGSAQ